MKLFNYIDFLLKLLIVIAIITSIYSELWHLASVSMLLLLLLFIPQIIKKSHKIVIPREFEVLLIIFVLFIVFYKNLGMFLTPIFFGIAIGFVGFLIILILYSDNKVKKDYLFIVLFAFCLSITSGFLIELFKYYLKLFLGHNIENLYMFSMNMMSYVTLGALLACIFGYIYMKKDIKFLGKIVKKVERANPNLFLKKSASLDEVKSLIKKGESREIEFKSTLRKNIYTGDSDKKIENSALKTLVGFMNTEGGTLLIGVNDNGDICGLERDNFMNNDKLNLHLVNLIKTRIGKNYISLIEFEVIKIKNKEILKIRCAKSNKPVFLKEDEKEKFYIRLGPGNTELSGSSLIEYIKKRFE